MSLLCRQEPEGHSSFTASPAPVMAEAYDLYSRLVTGDPDKTDLQAADNFLQTQIDSVKNLPTNLPSSPDHMLSSIEQHNRQVGEQYARYLKERRSGAPRSYFRNKSHARYFLKGVSPTKLVDGAWLYGLLPRWKDEHCYSLIKIYLEELGEGVAEKNHVALYRKLLATEECANFDGLDDTHFLQGAIQLALAWRANHFLPEIIGFNLGYEQLPLHLLITAYELNELGIDPYYFTLHITVDNFNSGHARRALEALLRLLPKVGDTNEFLARVRNGYLLNNVGASTTSVIASFDLDRELIAILRAKSAAGKQMHSDYCRVAGKTINEWLAIPEEMPVFLASLEKMGWIRRNEDPRNSRFWKLIQGSDAQMFGVFNVYEQQIIYDWIAGSMTEEASDKSVRQLTYRASQRWLGHSDFGARAREYGLAPRSIIRHRPGRERPDDSNDFNSELRMLEESLVMASNRDEAISRLIPLMSPANHYSPAGLMATRIFTKLLG